MERRTIFKQVILAVIATLLSGNVAYGQLRIKGVELNSNFSSATGGPGYNNLGLDLNAKLRLHHEVLPDNFDFYVGLHQKMHHWDTDGGPEEFYFEPTEAGHYVHTQTTSFHPASSFFDKRAIRRFMISFGPAYTMYWGKHWGWTNDLQLMFSPYTKSKLHYDQIDILNNTVEHKSKTLNNGLTLGVGINSCIWWKMPFKSKHNYKLGLNLGYEYIDIHKPLRNYERNGMKIFDTLTKRLNHVGHIGLNLGIAFN